MKVIPQGEWGGGEDDGIAPNKDVARERAQVQGDRSVQVESSHLYPLWPGLPADGQQVLPCLSVRRFVCICVYGFESAEAEYELIIV